MLRRHLVSSKSSWKYVNRSRVKRLGVSMLWVIGIIRTCTCLKKNPIVDSTFTAIDWLIPKNSPCLQSSGTSVSVGRKTWEPYAKFPLRVRPSSPKFQFIQTRSPRRKCISITKSRRHRNPNLLKPSLWVLKKIRSPSRLWQRTSMRSWKRMSLTTALFPATAMNRRCETSTKNTSRSRGHTHQNCPRMTCRGWSSLWPKRRSNLEVAAKPIKLMKFD